MAENDYSWRIYVWHKLKITVHPHGVLWSGIDQSKCRACLDSQPDLEIVVDPGIRDPSNKMGLAETFGAYSCYFVVNSTVKNHAIFS